MDTTQVIEMRCPAKPENFAKFKFNYDYIVFGLAHRQLNFEQINNLIKVSGLSECDKALLHTCLNDKIVVHVGWSGICNTRSLNEVKLAATESGENG